MIDFLKNDKEKLPNWLLDYTDSKSLNMRRVLNSRWVCYPGAGADLDCINYFNLSGSAHVYFYLDYLADEFNYLQEIKSKKIENYHILDDFNYKLNKNQIKKFLENKSKREAEFDKKSVPFCHVFIYERDEDANNKLEKRFALFYLGMDGIYTYLDLYKKHPVYGLYLTSTGFACNYDSFCKGGLMERLAFLNEALPKYIIARGSDGDGVAWDGYDIIAGTHKDITYSGEIINIYSKRNEEIGYAK